MARAATRKTKRRVSSRSHDERHGLHLIRLFPNIVTLLGLCAGLSSIRFALIEKWEMSVGFIVLAAMLDAVDGRLARMLNASSNFGAQLDSLADFVNFGVAPAIVMYLWQLNIVGPFGWAIVLFYTVCAAIRLARFNSDLDGKKPKPDWHIHFFVGVPSPAGALSIIYPLILVFTFKNESSEFYRFINFTAHPFFLMGYMAFVGVMMASRFPTLSLKRIRIPRSLVSFVLVLVAFGLIMFISAPWPTLTVVGVLYMISLPAGALSYLRFKQQTSEKKSGV